MNRLVEFAAERRSLSSIAVTIHDQCGRKAITLAPISKTQKRRISYVGYHQSVRALLNTGEREILLAPLNILR